MATITLGEVLNYISGQRICINLFGITVEANKKLHNFYQTLGDIIVIEQGITREEGFNLSLETELGEKSHRKFLEFQSWVSENS